MDQVHDMKRIINEYKETYRTVLFFSDENIESIKKAKSYKSLLTAVIMTNKKIKK